jgi:hypothetical protein
MDLSHPLARGRTAEIFALPDGSVLKLYEKGFTEDQVVRECRGLLWAREKGLPVPKVGVRMYVEGRYGFALERVDGLNGMSIIMNDVDSAVEEARKLAQLHIRVNACDGGRLPDRRLLLKARIEPSQELSESEKRFLLDMTEDLPFGSCLIHGDFHPGNTIWSQSGPVIIDWVDAGRGDPTSDVARSLVLFGVPLINSRADENPRHRYTQSYLEEYQRLAPLPLERLDEWMLVTSAARMAEGAAKGDQFLRDQVHEALKRRMGGSLR